MGQWDMGASIYINGMMYYVGLQCTPYKVKIHEERPPQGEGHRGQSY